MRYPGTMALLAIGLTVTLATACGSSSGDDDASSDTDTDADTDTDTDTDADADTDTETDTDTDTETDTYPFVECDVLPTSCEDVAETEEEQWFGCCFENDVYWCEQGQLDFIDCDAGGASCAYNPYGEHMDCMS
jgi:hypothetical protein